jgi:hypothetical protein
MGKIIGQQSVGKSSLETVRLLQPLIAGLRERDAALTDQLLRALTNLAMSTSRLRFAERGEKRAHVLAALASASEAGALLRMAVDWRYCTWPAAKPAYEELNRTAVLLRKLAYLRKPRSKVLRRVA